MNAPDLFSMAAALSIGSTSTTPKRKGNAKREPFDVQEGDGSIRRIEPFGRDAWALRELIGAGIEGCTPLRNVGPRWSAYVFKLKRVYGLSIETIHEQHRGEFSGHHARYVLRSRVVPIGEGPSPVRFPASHTVGAVVTP